MPRVSKRVSISLPESSSSESEDDNTVTNNNESRQMLERLKSERSIIARNEDDELADYQNDEIIAAAESQDHRSFLSRVIFNETDVRFYNDTNREVLFVIADEEFTLKRTKKAKSEAKAGNDDDDDDGDDINLGNVFGNIIPISASCKYSMTESVQQKALKTRWMPIAPHSSSTQHFKEERLTYVTALTKDEDGEDQPWTRVHYENKVINCRQTKAFKFCQKHLKISCYRIGGPAPLTNQGTINSTGKGNGMVTYIMAPPSSRKDGGRKTKRLKSG